MLGDKTNGVARPEPQQQTRPRRALGDISNRAASTASNAGSAKQNELPPIECMHACEPAPAASFDLASALKPEAVARAASEHRAPIFGSAAVGRSGVPPLALEQMHAFPTIPAMFGASPGPMPAFRGAPPSPFALAEAEAPPSPKMELDLSFALLAPALSKLQVNAPDDSDEEMELDD